MEKSDKRIVVSRLISNETKMPYCMVSQVKKGISKKNGNPYEILDTEQRETIDADYPARYSMQRLPMLFRKPMNTHKTNVH